MISCGFLSWIYMRLTLTYVVGSVPQHSTWTNKSEQKNSTQCLQWHFFWCLHCLEYTKNIVQGDTKKPVIAKSRMASGILFGSTRDFSHIRSGLCSRHAQSVKSVQQKLFVSLAHKNVLYMSSPALQAHLDPAGKVLDDPPALNNFWNN